MTPCGFEELLHPRVGGLQEFGFGSGHRRACKDQGIRWGAEGWRVGGLLALVFEGDEVEEFLSGLQVGLHILTY